MLYFSDILFYSLLKHELGALALQTFAPVTRKLIVYIINIIFIIMVIVVVLVRYVVCVAPLVHHLLLCHACTELT